MTDTGVVDLDADLVCLGWCNLDVLDGEVLACLPGDCGLCPGQRRASNSAYHVVIVMGAISRFPPLLPCASFADPRCCGSARQGRFWWWKHGMGA
jgi:hypothetical protein